MTGPLPPLQCTTAAQGRATVAIVSDGVTNFVGVGVAMRNPEDAHSDMIGEGLAMARALGEYAAQVEQAAFDASCHR